jgi:hypothetical protein
MARGNRTATPSSCRTSDLLNQIAKFVEENPLWFEDNASVRKVGMAYQVLTKITPKEDVSQEEEDFIMGIFNTIEERAAE